MGLLGDATLWRRHIAPAKPNGPIPLDLNDKRWNFTGQIVFFICHRADTDLYRVYTRSCPAWYRTLHPHIVISCRSHRVLTACIPPPLKYVMLLWNIYFCSEIYIAALKYVLLHQNIYCYSEICYPDGMHTFANHHYAVKYSITASYRQPPPPPPPPVLLPCSYRVLTMCHRLYPVTVPTRRKVLSMSKTFAGSCRVSPAANGPPTCSPIAQRRPHEIYHTVAHGRLSRCHMWQLH